MELPQTQVLFPTLLAAASNESLKTYTILTIKLFTLKNHKEAKNDTCIYISFLSWIRLTLPVALPVVWSVLGPVDELVVVPLPDNQSKSSV